MKIYDKLKQIENEFNGNEYFEHGVSFCIGFDALDINIPLKKAVKNVLVEYKAICETEDTKVGCSYGNINSVFRIIECENEYILVELYVVD